MTAHTSRIYITPVVSAVIIMAALVLFPGAEPISTFVSVALIGAASLLLLHRMKLMTQATSMIMLAALTVMSVSVIINVWGFTTLSGTTTAQPVLENADQYRYFHDALSITGLENGELSRGHHRGYGLLIAALWSVTGVTIVSPLILNIGFTMATLLLTATITSDICHDRDKRCVAVAMGALAAMCYFINSSTLLLKEAPTATAMAMFAYSFICRGNRRSIVAFIAATLLLSVIRCEWLFMAMVGIAVTSPTLSHKINQRRLTMIIIVAIALTVSNIAFDSTHAVTLSADARSYSAGQGSREVLWSVLGDYFSFQPWKKLLLLPLSAAIQFLTPFPWNFSRDMVYGLTQCYAHISYPWYLFGGIVIYWLFSAVRQSSEALLKLTLWGIMLWLIPCYMFAGTVSRYTLPMLPLLAPAVAFTLTTSINKRSFRVYMSVFTLITAVTLIVLYSYLQLS